MTRTTSPRSPGNGLFASLRFHNYRIWFLSALVANTGTWMQRVAQDWLVLRVLTHDSASATGLTTALQFLPMLLLSAHAGLVADRVDQRKFLILTQSAMGLVSAVVAIDVLAGTARLWHVYLAAFLGGLAAAYDARPARPSWPGWCPPSTCPTPWASTPPPSTPPGSWGRRSPESSSPGWAPAGSSLSTPPPSSSRPPPWPPCA